MKRFRRIVNESLDPVLVGRDGLELSEGETDSEGVLQSWPVWEKVSSRSERETGG